MLFDPIQASRSLAVINIQKNSSVQSAEAHENKLADTAAKSATSHKVTEIFLTKTSSISSLPPVFYLHQRLAKGQASSPEVERGTWIRNGCSFSSLKYRTYLTIRGKSLFFTSSGNTKLYFCESLGRLATNS